jgi:subtilisin family serine protease
MRLRFCQFYCLILGLAGTTALAQNQYILRPATQGTVSTLAQKYGLTVVQPVDDNQKAFVVTGPATAAPKDLEKEVGDDQDVSNFELDQSTGLPEVTQSTAAILDSLPTPTSVTYYGASVLAFYTAQPAVTFTRIPDAQALGINGTGIVVAIIDTGVDPSHPVLQSQLLPGYDFVHNLPGTASEWIDLTADNQAALVAVFGATSNEKYGSDGEPVDGRDPRSVDGSNPRLQQSATRFWSRHDGGRDHSPGGAVRADSSAKSL